MQNRNQLIVSEGYPFIILFGFITLVFALLGWVILTLLFLFLTLFSSYFFRNPERVIPTGEDLLIAPADGKIIFVGEVQEDRYFKEQVTKISIFMSVL